MNAILQSLRDKADMNDDGKIDKADLDLAIKLSNQLVDEAEAKVTPIGAMLLASKWWAGF